MRVRIQGDGDEQALTDLQDWLSRDPQARQLSVAPVSTPGTTMSVLHALDIVLNRGMEIANFAVAYASWRIAKAGAATRGARTLTHGGSTVDIGHLDSAQLADLLRRLQNESTDTGTHQS
ncbi:effector-associated constant component EACC1 [Streptomyces longwoodensis]